MDNQQNITNKFKDFYKVLGDEDLAKYLLSTPKDVERAFKELIITKELVTVYADDGETTLLTTMFNILPNKGMFVFDKGQDSQINAKIEASKQLLFSANPQQVEIKFTSEKAISARYHNDSVFAAPIPESLYRIQRREFFRVETPIINPVTCQIPGVNGSKVYDLFDISVGGIGINDPGYQLEGLALFDTIEDCILHIPEFGEIRLELEIRSIYEKQLKTKTIRRFGFDFSHKEIPNIHMTAIQRYINNRQLKMRAHKLNVE